MLSPLSRAVAFYLGGGAALALLCSIWFFDHTDDERALSRRRRRRALILSPIGVFHPIVALTAVGLARGATEDDTASTGAVVAATASLVVSVVGMATVFVVAA